MQRTTVFRTFLITALVLILPTTLWAHDPDFTTELDRDRCHFSSTGSNPYLPLWPGLQTVLEGEEEDDEGETIEISVTTTVLHETELVDGVITRVVEERELEDGELVEVSRNFFAYCRETGDVWYFGEDVDDYEDGMIVGHEGEWRAGENGAEPGIVMPGTPLIGARFFEEIAPGVALDRGEIAALGEEADVPAGSFEDLLVILDSNALAPEDGEEEKFYARGLGNIIDEDLELVELNLPPCVPDETTHCLSNGRFRVEATWANFTGGTGDGQAILPSADSGEFWFFDANNTELVVKVIDACSDPRNSFWVFAAGLTNVEVEIVVTDTQSGQMRFYDNDLGMDFEPVLDTQAFLTCP